MIDATNITYQIGDTVWVETSAYSASRAKITFINGDSYYVQFIDRTNRQCTDINSNGVPVLKRQIQPIDYIGWDK